MAEIFMNHALIILCGGGSTRMGTDKALLPFGEVSLLEYLVNKYKPHFSHIYLSVKKPGEYTHLSLPVTEIADLYMNAGPMSGVFSGLSMMDEDQTPLFWNQKSDCSCWSIWTVLTSPRYPAPKRIKKYRRPPTPKAACHPSESVCFCTSSLSIRCARNAACPI